jgi:hypothetical protein
MLKGIYWTEVKTVGQQCSGTRERTLRAIYLLSVVKQISLKLNILKHHIFITSYFLWVRNPRAVYWVLCFMVSHETVQIKI